MDLLKKNKLAAGIVVVVLAGVAWYFLTGSSQDTTAILTASSAVTVPPEAQRLVVDLQSLHAITLSGDIFSNQSFQALRDFSTAIIPEAVGRPDPFAPLSASANAQRVAAPATH